MQKMLTKKHIPVTFISPPDNLIGFISWHSISKIIRKKYTYGNTHADTT